MISGLKNGLLALCALGLLVAVTEARAGGARDVALRMIEAHGGMERWKSAPTVSYKHTMVAPSQPDDPWVSVETVEQGSRREYQDWPLDGARIVYDGERVWSTGWKRKNPPRFMVNMAYYFLNLPWVTQDPGVVLEGPGEGTLPHDEKTYTTLRMTFDPGTGDTPEDYYVLYIDPETSLLAGVEYIVTYGAMLDLFNLPPDVTYIGPLVKVFGDYTTVSGLTMPTTYKTYFNGQLYGDHTVEDISLSKPFDAARLEIPADAVIDNSSAKRRAQMTN